MKIVSEVPANQAQQVSQGFAKKVERRTGQGEEGHAEAAEGDEQVMGGEGHGSRCKTLLTNVTEAQGCVVKSFRGGCGRSSFL